MKIKIELSKKSINDAIKKINSIKKAFPKMVDEFLLRVAKWITDRANTYLDMSDIGRDVKEQIKGKWEYVKTEKGIKVLNTANTTKMVGGKMQTVPTAVLVEFGIGIVGQAQAHPNADKENYEYNVDSPAKQDDGSWHFFQDESQLDIPKSAIDWGMYGKGQSNRMSIYTRGTKGVWYAYNALVDANMEIQKTDGGEIGEIWNDIKTRYFK